MTHNNQNALRERVRWTELVLHFADGSGLVSVWDTSRACAIQRDGPRMMAEASATQEHLRALAELREEAGCTNWFASTTAHTVEPPPLEAIDWAGFEAPDAEEE